MTRQISLAHLTTLNLAPPHMIALAASLGYDMVGLRLIAVNDTTPGYPLMDDPALMRATKAALASTGLSVLDIEFVKITPDFNAATLERFVAAGGQLGARHIICAPYDPDLSRLANNLATFAELCRNYPIHPVLEFFPWTNVPDLASAIAVAKAAGDDLGILIDTLHFNRSGSQLSDIQALPHHRLPYLHLCDAMVQPAYSTEELLHTGRAERLPPGMGQIDLAAIISQMPPDIPVALEVPMTAYQAAKGVEAVARLALESARKVLNEPGLQR